VLNSGGGRTEYVQWIVSIRPSRIA
jgi:hypothetical protein